ncbi:serine/threonine-protein kinase [Streptomyces peucetius]|uniref:Serine/threonine protein kinase n=1 Tax=Streptomyces peucetius TaxID=1950 RepID=A0ABY6I905_STRPE|nr:serine/threonine-protein kinase [Streptomyces peucetius]UYQ63478.1 serine/threonine protein kinase [Streptomyces peucetius]
MDALMPEDPQQIGPFRLLGRLGVGGMGRVYLARSAGGRTVAVKLVRPELAAQDEFRRRFTREVEALERVGGSGTTPVIASDTAAESPWVAIGYVPGPSLRSVVVDQYGPLPAHSVRALAAGLADALGHVHAAGLLHRDLKPSNILLTVDGPRIIDFGIARAVDTVTDGGLTTTGAVVGSPGFMSPEQVRGERLTPASDIFCMGAVLAYAATGRPPFGSADSGVHAVLFRIAHEEPDLAGLPPELESLVRGCLEKDPAARPTSAELANVTLPDEPWLPAGLLAGLGRHAARLLDADGDPTPPTPVAAVPAAPRRRRRTALAAVCVAAVLIAAGTFAALTVRDGGGTDNTKGTPGATGSPAGASDGSDGSVPDDFLGAWEGVLRGSADAPYETGRIEITQGRAGEKTGVYVHVSGERLCMGRSTLVSADADRIVFGESDVTTSVPEKRCTPAAHQTLAVRSPDVLQWTSGEVSATFHRSKSGPEAVPPAFVGHWQQRFDIVDAPPDYEDPRSFGMTVTQGPVGAPLVRFTENYPRTDDETGEETGDLVHCESTAVLGGVGDLVILGPPVLETGSDPECSSSGSSQNLRVDRFEGKERLLMYGMSTDGEPAEYFRR